MLFQRLLRSRTAGTSLLASLTLLLGSASPSVAQHPPVVRGVVVDAASALPVPGARIEVTDGALETTSAGDGRFVLRGLAPGQRTLRATALGYEPRTVVVEARNGGSLELRVELAPRPLRLAGVDVDVAAPEDLAGVRVVGREEIEAAAGDDLGGLLDGLPEVTVLRRGPGGDTRATIRGGDPDEVLVLLDGMPLNSPLTGAVDLSTVPLSAVERIFVIPGARSARYGPRALAGVILIEARRYEATDLSAASSVGSRGRWTLEGSAGGVLRSDGPDDGTTWRGGVSARWRSSDGDFVHPVPEVRGGGRTRRRNADESTLDVTGVGTLERPSVTVRARGHVQRSGRGMPGPVVRPSPDARRRHERLAMHASVASPDGRWEVRVDGQREAGTYRDPDPPAGPAYDDRTSLRSFGASALGRVRAGGGRIETGGEVRRDRISSSMLASGAPGERTTAALWTTGRWRHRAGERWMLAASPALRADWSSLDDRLVLSPRLGLGVTRAPVSFRLSVGNAYAPPTLADQFFREGVRVRPNPELRAERVRGEVEATAEVTDRRIGPLRVDVRLSGFRSDVDGRILWMPDHRFVWRPENFDVERRGWEAEVEARWRADGPRATASVSRALTRYRGPALTGPVAYRPTETARLSAAAPVGPASVEIDGRYVGARRTVPGSPLNALDPYWSADLSIRGRVSLGSWTIEPGLRIENVFDRAVEMFPDFPLPGRGWRLEIRAGPGDGAAGPAPDPAPSSDR